MFNGFSLAKFLWQTKMITPPAAYKSFPDEHTKIFSFPWRASASSERIAFLLPAFICGNLRNLRIIH